MAITVYENKGGGNKVVAGARYYLTVDGRLVKEGDPAAYRLYCHPHHEVPAAEFKALLEASGLGETASAEKPKPAKKKAASKKKARA